MVEWLGFPVNASAHGPELDKMTALVHWMMLLLFVGWGLYFIYALIRFRAGRNPNASYTGAKGTISKASEVAVAVVEVLLLVFFAIPAWAKWVRVPPPQEGALEVRVVAEQFAWNVHYPGPDGLFGRVDASLMNSNNPLGLDRADAAAKDDITTINQLHLPANRPVVARLSSKDVIHSFGLPVMRVKQDMIPGLEIPVHFTPVLSTPADSRFPGCAKEKRCWEIACAQLCGLGHFRMRGFLTVESPAEFEAWLAAQATG